MYIQISRARKGLGARNDTEIILDTGTWRKIRSTELLHLPSLARAD